MSNETYVSLASLFEGIVDLGLDGELDVVQFELAVLAGVVRVG
jgi:hypothetical protein